MKKFNIFLLVILIVTLIMPINSSFANEEQQVKFDKLQVSFWVEFDQPEKWANNEPNVLFMYNGSVYNKSNTDFTGRVGFFIPGDNVYVNMICELEKGMLCQPYTIDKVENGSYISWKPSRPIKPNESFPFMLEVYYNPIVGSVDKTIDFTFTPSLDIDTLEMDIKAPLKGTNFKVEPPQQQVVKDNGFDYYLYNFKNLKSKETKAFKIAYTKEGSEPSVAAVQQTQQTSQPSNNASPSKQSKGKNWGVAFMILVLTTVIIGLLVRQIIKNNKYNRMIEDQEQELKDSISETDSKYIRKEKAKARKLLLEGKISEETYQQIISDLE